LLLVNVVNAAQNFVTINATSCTDSEGNCNVTNVQSQDGITESQVGHNSGTRYIETTNSNTTAITSPNSIDNVTVYIDRFESANPSGQTITLQARRPSDNTASSCTLSAKTTNDNTYDGCDVTSLIKGSSTPESDAEGLAIRYSIQKLGASNTMYLDHAYVNITYNDTSAPTIILNSPSNDSWKNTSNMTFQFTPNDVTSGISSCRLVLNNVLNQTNSSITENQVNYITSSLNQGLNNWTINCTDTSANTNVGTNTSIRIVNIDLTNTTIQLNYPVNMTNSSQTLQSFNFTPIDNLASTFTCRLFVNNTNVNSTTVTNNTPTILTHNISQGKHTWHIQCEDLASNTNISETRNITIDFTNPIVENISYSPSLEAELDPNTIVNVTANITDNVELYKIILQYKLKNETSWNETLMSLQSGNVYKASFNATDGNWSFRIFANDTIGNQNISNITNISVITDRTWENTTVFLSVKAIVQDETRFFSVGNLTINNTGDIDLNFTVNSSQTWINVNGTGSNNSISFIVNKTYNATTINVTANTTGFAVGEYNFNVTIYAFTLNPTLISSQILSGKVVIQNVAGPYFTVTIIKYDATVTQGDTGVNLSASVKNDGTGDATEAWLAWTLPSGWSNTSGVLNKTMGTLGIGTTVTNVITVSISSSATTGTFTLLASAGSAENVTGNDTKTVTVNAAPTTTTTTAAPSGGGGGVSTGALIEKILSGEEILSSSETFELVRGYSNSFPVSVKNIFDGTTLENVSIKIEGLLSQYMTFSPSVIDKIKFKEQKQFNVTIKSPEYMEKGEHKLTIIVTGKIVSATVRKDLTDTRDVKLVIHTVSEEVVNASLQQAITDINEMEKAGFPVAKVSKLLDQAKEALAEHKNDDAKDLTEKIKEIKEESLQAYSIIQEIKSKIKNYGSITGFLNRSSITGAFLVFPNRFTETENAINLALAAFERGDFAIALQRAKDAKMTFALERGEFNPIFFLVDYWWAILISMGILSVSGFFGYQTYQKTTITQKIINLKKEEDTIRELMAETQRKRFTEKALGPETFNRTISQYQQRLSKIMKLRIKLRHKRTRILKPQEVVKDLEGERKEIVNLLKELQKDYFVNRKISKIEYSEQTKVYNERLAEIEDEQMVLETKMYVGGKK
jgi:uncharacterized membrane protein